MENKGLGHPPENSLNNGGSFEAQGKKETERKWGNGEESSAEARTAVTK